MEYREYAPPARLAPFIRCFWTLRSPPLGSGAPREGAGIERLIPDGSPEIVLQLGDPFLEWEQGGARPRSIEQPEAIVAGQLRGPLLLSPAGSVDIVAVRFRPAGLRPFLGGIDARELLDRRIAVAELSPALARALDRVRLARGAAGRVSALASALEGAQGESRIAGAGPVAAAVEAIVRSGGTATAEELRRAAGIHERSLQRGFRREVGLSPKRLSRIVRFQRFFRALEAAPPAGVAGLALDCGYYDQPHLLRDARELAGGAVGALAEGSTLARLFSRGEPGGETLSGTSKRGCAGGRENGAVGCPIAPER